MAQTVDPAPTVLDWQSPAVSAQVLALIRGRYGPIAGRPHVHPLYQVQDGSRWRVNYREDGRITSSFRVLARLSESGLTAGDITRDACRPG